jgi:hypothetical protein
MNGRLRAGDAPEAQRSCGHTKTLALANRTTLLLTCHGR